MISIISKWIGPKVEEYGYSLTEWKHTYFHPYLCACRVTGYSSSLAEWKYTVGISFYDIGVLNARLTSGWGKTNPEENSKTEGFWGLQVALHWGNTYRRGSLSQDYWFIFQYDETYQVESTVTVLFLPGRNKTPTRPIEVSFLPKWNTRVLFSFWWRETALLPDPVDSGLPLVGVKQGLMRRVLRFSGRARKTQYCQARHMVLPW